MKHTRKPEMEENMKRALKRKEKPVKEWRPNPKQVIQSDEELEEKAFGGKKKK